MRSTLAPIFLAATTTLLASVGNAQDMWPEDPSSAAASVVDEDHPRVTLGLRLGYGSAITGTPSDAASDPTLLSGSAFTGSTLRIGGVARGRISPAVVLRGELAYVRQQLAGFADGPDFRRDITFTTSLVELPVGVELGADLGTVDIGAHLGISGRLQIATAAEDVREGTAEAEPELEVRTGAGAAAFIGAQAGVWAGNLRIPLEVRYQRSLTYPSSTIDRYDDFVNLNAPGAYLSDANWSVIVSLGLDIGLSPSEPEPEVYIAPPPPPPPPPPPEPDNDGDGVPDALDACPIEPGNMGADAGCPASGGIVRLSCDVIEISSPIIFESGSDVLDGASYPVLYLIADTMIVSPNVRLVSIEGHTDDQGPADANQELSERRAYAVLDFLTMVGVEDERLQAVGYGEEYPIAPNDSAEGRAENRRVEFLILSNTTCGN